jgi:predicted nuclease with TOPRIM domain
MKLIDKIKAKRIDKIKKLTLNKGILVEEAIEYDSLLESLEESLEMLENLQSIIAKQSNNMTEKFNDLRPSKFSSLKGELEKCFELFEKHNDCGRQFISNARLLYKKLFDHKNKFFLHKKKNSQHKRFNK